MFYNLKRAIRRKLSSIKRMTEKPRFTAGPRYSGNCTCCGGSEITQIDILYDELIDVWGLSPEETAYINRQQGLRCSTCGARLRSMALAAWICENFDGEGPLAEVINSSQRLMETSILEINEAGQLTQFLRKLPRHTLGCYPDVDIQSLCFSDASYELVIHSDTLEHVPDPVQALRECRRVLKKGGQCVYTVPLLVDRLTRSTVGGKASYHGAAGVETDDFRVRTEFGSDSWKVAIEAGFKECSIYSLEYPAALVHICRK